MKKWILISMFVSLVLVLTACGGAQDSTAVATPSTELSLEGQLLVGTIKLESTNLAVSSEQADQLLLLWDTLQSLESSGTAASEEIDAVVNQIEETMSTEQLSSITAMNLTRQDLAAAMAETDSSVAASGDSSPGSVDAFQVGAGPQGGGDPPGDMGGGMPASMGAQSDIQMQIQAGVPQADTTLSSATAIQISPALIKTLVEILRNKIA